jgi:hypothetical protein
MTARLSLRAATKSALRAAAFFAEPLAREQGSEGGTTMAQQAENTPEHDERIGEDEHGCVGFEQAARERAYLLWERDGRPEGRADEYWLRALEELTRSRAFAHWEQARGRQDEAGR